MTNFDATREGGARSGPPDAAWLTCAPSILKTHPRKRIMAKTYLKVIPVPGKWYVSERFQADSTRWQIVDAAQSQPKRSASEKILAGPFDTRDLAVKWNIRTSASGYAS